MDLTFDDLLSTGAHFGHLTRKWHPNYRPYILMAKHGVHIINLDETLKGLQKAIDFLSETIENGGEILFVGTKKNAKDIVQQEADKCGMFYVVERWLGGTLTNFSTIRKSIKRLQLLEKESSPLYENATKKEILALEREMIRLQDLHRGIKDMKRLPDAIFVVDAGHELIAVKEAHRLNIPVVAVVDTNTDPELVEFTIPANDDSIRAVKLLVGEVAKAICRARSAPYPGDEAVLAEAEIQPEEELEVSPPDESEKEVSEEAAMVISNETKKEVSEKTNQEVDVKSEEVQEET